MSDTGHQTQRLVLPSDLNQYGFLFGGRMLAWVDEASWIAATLEFPGCKFVTIAMDKVEFRHSVREGSILTIRSQLSHKGRSSVTYMVDVHSQGSDEVIFTTQVTFVRVDEAGKKLTLP